MEFVAYGEVMDLLKQQGVREVEGGDGRVYLELTRSNDIAHLDLVSRDSTAAPRAGASVVKVDKDRLAVAVDHLIHKLRLNQVLLIPVGKWRNVFDAVAFSMADNEDWQAVDTAATVELNGRDPLLCEPGDFHTLTALIKTLLDDADRPEQGMMITTTAGRVIMELVPEGAVRISVGNLALADEIAETFCA